jgi:hypothetical protein
MASTGVVTNVTKPRDPVRPVPPVLPLERRVVDASARPVNSAGKAAEPGKQGADAGGTLAACIHRLLPGSLPKGDRRLALAPDASDVGKNIDATRVDGAIELQEQRDVECIVVAAGLMPALGNQVPPTTAMHDGTSVPAADRSDPAGPRSEPASPRGAEGIDAGSEVHAEDAADFRASPSVSPGVGPARPGKVEAERAHEDAPERQTVLTQLSHEGPTAASDGDTLRFTYQFRSWQGQPFAQISLNFNDSSRKLNKVSTSDGAVFSALLANRDGLAGTVKIVDYGPDSRGRQRDQREQGE